MAKIDTLNISFTDKNARRRGPTSSDDWNDTHDELIADLAGLYDQWNNRLKTLTNALPDGTVDTTIDAFVNGLDGQTIYTKSDAAIDDDTYYNDTDIRPNTLYEQFVNVYSYIDGINQSLGVQITGSTPAASGIGINDTNQVFDSFNVEDALYELYQLFATGFFLTGTGSPEGIVIGAVGAIFVRTDGGAGQVFWVKESGSGNTGWVAK